MLTTAACSTHVLRILSNHSHGRMKITYRITNIWLRVLGQRLLNGNMFFNFSYCWIGCIYFCGWLIYAFGNDSLLRIIFTHSVFTYSGLNDFNTLSANDIFGLDIYWGLLTIICHEVLNVLELLIHLEQVISQLRAFSISSLVQHFFLKRLSSLLFHLVQNFLTQI